MNINKTLLTASLAISLFSFNTGKSQTVDSDLAQTYAAFDSAKTYPQMMMAGNSFKLIAKQYPTDWLANYYAAYSIAVMSFREPNKNNRDAMLDEADAYFKKIQHMDTINDEVAVLGALLSQARLSVAPMSRHGKYGAIANQYYELVKKVNPDNPRMFYLRGNSLFYTPKLFGGGADKALPVYEKADSLFGKDSKAINKPHWGKKETEYMMKQCKDKTN